MPDTFKFKLEGATALMADFREIPEEVTQRVLRRAVRKASDVIHSAVVARTPRRTGALAQNMRVKIKAYPKNLAVVGIIGPESRVTMVATDPTTGRQIRVRPANYAHLVEYGVAPHAVGAKSERIERRARRRGLDTPGKQEGWMHPGFEGRGFMRKAFFESSPRAEQVLISEIKLGIERAARRRARQSGKARP